MRGAWIAVERMYVWVFLLLIPASLAAENPAQKQSILARPDLFKPLTEPPCSYCATQHRKNFVQSDDLVLAWLRGDHNGGAISVRHFLSAPRVINDTYGLFFYDPDGGFVAAYAKDYGYKFHGWRRGVMVVEGRDGTLWSALSGRAFQGPQQGNRLERIPNMVTTWGHWLLLHPESTAYDLFDGKTYALAPLPTSMAEEAKASMGQVDDRMEPLARVLGVEMGDQVKAYALESLGDRACVMDQVAGAPIAVFWYGPTESGVAFSSVLDGQQLTFDADETAPETAPFKDRETGTRWTLAGRGVDGPLRGKELTWVHGIQCRWYAWVAENPQTLIHDRVDKER